MSIFDTSSKASRADSNNVAPPAAPRIAPVEREGVGINAKPYLPADAALRKAIPLCTGVLDYFPLALAEVAKVSKAGNDQHNPGQPLHWNRSKSTDQADTIMRHLIERGGLDTDGQRHTAKLVWRALAELQIEMEEALGLPMSRGSREK